MLKSVRDVGRISGSNLFQLLTRVQCPEDHEEVPQLQGVERERGEKKRETEREGERER